MNFLASRKIWLPPRNIVVFGVVGVLATTVHFTIGLTIVGFGLLRPFSANIVAFLTAFMVSYVGHHRFTFRSSEAHRDSLPKFFFVAVIGLALNQLIVFVMVDTLGLQYYSALIVVVLVVPIMTYLLGKVWVFNDRPDVEASFEDIEQ